MRRVAGPTFDGGGQLLTMIPVFRSECLDILKDGSEVDKARPKRRPPTVAGNVTSAHLELEADRDVLLERVPDRRRLEPPRPQLGDLISRRARLGLEADRVQDALVASPKRALRRPGRRPH